MYLNRITQIENRYILLICLIFALTVSTFSQGKTIGNFEIVQKSPLGYLPLDSKHLPILVTTKEENKKLAKLENTTNYLNATEKQKSLMVAQTGIKYAYLGNNNDYIVPFGVYDFADAFGLGRKAIVAKNGKYGIINEFGKLVLQLEYDFIERPSNFSNYAKIYLATQQKTVTVFDENLSEISIKGIATYLDNNGNIFITSQENKKGLLNYKGEQTIPFLYDTLYQVCSNGYIAKKDSLYGYIAKNNEIIQPFKYNYIYTLNGYAAYVNLNNKVGIFDEKGEIMIPFEFDAIYDTYYNQPVYNTLFQSIENIYIVEKNGKIGTIDDKNNVIIPIIYDRLSGWVEYGPEAHFVKNNNKYGIISPNGQILIPIEYDYVGLPQDDIVRVIKNGKYGVVSWKTKEILPCIYDKIVLDIPLFNFGDEEQIPKIVTLKQNVWKYFDLKGKLLRSNVPLKEINDKYDYVFKLGKPSNEHYDFDLKQKGGLKKNE